MLDMQAYLQQRTKTYIGTIEASEFISEKNKEVIRRFVQECYAEGLGHRRVRKLLTCLHRIFKITGKDFPLLDADKEKIEKLVEERRKLTPVSMARSLEPLAKTWGVEEEIKKELKTLIEPYDKQFAESLDEKPLTSELMKNVWIVYSRDRLGVDV